MSSFDLGGGYFNLVLFLSVLVPVELQYALFCTKDCHGPDQQLATALICIPFCGELIFFFLRKPKFRQIFEMPMVPLNGKREHLSAFK